MKSGNLVTILLLACFMLVAFSEETKAVAPYESPLVTFPNNMYYRRRLQETSKALRVQEKEMETQVGGKIYDRLSASKNFAMKSVTALKSGWSNVKKFIKDKTDKHPRLTIFAGKLIFAVGITAATGAILSTGVGPGVIALIILGRMVTTLAFNYWINNAVLGKEGPAELSEKVEFKDTARDEGFGALAAWDGWVKASMAEDSTLGGEILAQLKGLVDITDPSGVAGAALFLITQMVNFGLTLHAIQEDKKAKEEAYWKEVCESWPYSSRALPDPKKAKAAKKLKDYETWKASVKGKPAANFDGDLKWQVFEKADRSENDVSATKFEIINRAPKRVKQSVGDINVVNEQRKEVMPEQEISLEIPETTISIPMEMRVAAFGAAFAIGGLFYRLLFKQQKTQQEYVPLEAQY